MSEYLYKEEYLKIKDFRYFVIVNTWYTYKIDFTLIDLNYIINEIQMH